MAELELLNNNALQLDIRPEGNQSEDKDPSVNNILDPPRIGGIPEGEPLTIKDGPSNIDNEISESHYSELDKYDATLRLSMLDNLKKEATTDRKRNLHVDLENKVTKLAEDHFCKAEYSHIQTKYPREQTQEFSGQHISTSEDYTKVTGVEPIRNRK